MIATAHQPNFLPGWGVIRKILQADAVVFLDEVQFTSPGWSNRQRMPDGKWLTVPVQHPTMVPFNRVRISDRKPWRERAVGTIRQHYLPKEGSRTRSYPQLERRAVAELVCAEIMRPYGLLIGLNLAVLRALLDPHEWDGDDTRWHFQSHLDGGHAVTAQGSSEAKLRPISERLAMMVGEVGGSTYLSGPSGRNYLDERPFEERGITVDYYSHGAQTLDCALGVNA